VMLCHRVSSSNVWKDQSAFIVRSKQTCSQSPVTTDGQSVKPYWYQAVGKVCDLGMADVGSRVPNS